MSKSEKIKKLNQVSQMRIMEDEVRGCLQVPTMKDLKKMVALSGFFDSEENRKAFRNVKRELKKLNVNTEVY